MGKSILYFIFFFFILSSSLTAQISKLYFTNYSVKDGLSHGIVNNLFRDSEGFLWVATFSGLNRFDGTNFQKFFNDRHNPNLIINNNVHQICEDKQGRIWCSTQGGVSCYNKTTGLFKNYILENPIESPVMTNKVFEILCDRHGTIWCGSWGGLFQFDSAHNTFKGYFFNEKYFSTNSTNSITKKSMLEDPVKDGIWIAGRKGIHYFDTHTKNFYSYRNNPRHLKCFENKHIFPLQFDKKGNMWYASPNEDTLYCYHVSTNQLEKIPFKTTGEVRKHSTFINCIFFDSQNRMWVSDWSYALYYKDAGSNVWQYFSHDERDASSINGNFFWDVLEDNDGTLWFGGINGLSKYEPQKQSYSLIKPAETSSENFKLINIGSLYQQNDSILWLSSKKNLCEYNLHSGNLNHFSLLSKVSDLDFEIGGITEIEGEYWLATNNGIYFFDPETKKYFINHSVPAELLNTRSHVNMIYQSKNGDIWITVAGHLYRYIKNDNKWTRFIHNDANTSSIDEELTGCICEDYKGNMWFGTEKNGLMRYDTAKRSFDFFREYREGASTKKLDNIFRIMEGHKGELYIIHADKGLVRFNYETGQTKLWQQSDGLASESNFQLAKDNIGNIWIAGYQDVSILNTKNNTIQRLRIDYANADYNYYNALALLNNGDVCISILDALAIFNPSKLKVVADVPKVLISNLSVFEKPVPYTEMNPFITLNYKQNFFSISFSSFEKLDTRLQYAYKLQGYDVDWVYSGNRKFASYTNVPPGEYAFFVKAGTEEGKWSANPSVIHIVIVPPFWQTWWFRVLAGVIIIAVVFIVIKLRERKLLRDEKLQSEFRERITASEMQALRSQMNPHFLYNSLNAIRLFVLQNDSDNAEKYLVKFARLMRLILDNSREELIHLNSELDQLKLYMGLEQLRFDNKFDFAISVDNALQSAKVAIPPMILQPYVENAILHGIAHKQTKGCIQVSITTSDHQFECVIEDNGVGREKAAQLKAKISSHKSVGLKVTEERLQLLSIKSGKQTSVQVIDLYDENKLASGTKVIIHLPLMAQ